MPFFVAVLSFKRKKFCTHLAAVEAFLKNDDSGKAALTSLEEDATATEETQEKVSFWKFVFRPGSFQKSKRKQHAMSYQQSGRRMNTLVNSCGPFAFVACQTSVLM